ncbi:MAG TPA: ATP-binding protein [Phycisphaerales bacterium]|nr:ATP-binding protein [Phycisphaerales bacterium]
MKRPPHGPDELVIAGMLAHELRSLFTPVLARCAAARRVGADAAGACGAIEDGIRRFLRLAELVLATGASAGPATCDVSEIVRALSPGAEAPPGIRAGIDGLALEHVLMNLLDNARRGGGVVSVRALRAPLSIPAGAIVSCSPWNAGAEVVQVLVVDTGRGISPEAMKTLFRPWASHAGGSGIGLALCARLIHAAGGLIWVASRPGQETTAAVCLKPAASGFCQNDHVLGEHGDRDVRAAA